MKLQRSSITNRAAFFEGCLILLAGAALGWHALNRHAQLARVDWALSPYLFPLLVSMGLFILGILLMQEGMKPQHQSTKQPLHWPTVVMTIGCALCYFLLMPFLGFALATALFLLAMLLFLGERRVLMLILLPLVFSAVLYTLFGKLLHVMLPGAPVDVLGRAIDLIL